MPFHMGCNRRRSTTLFTAAKSRVTSIGGSGFNSRHGQHACVAQLVRALQFPSLLFSVEFFCPEQAVADNLRLSTGNI